MRLKIKENFIRKKASKVTEEDAKKVISKESKLFKKIFRIISAKKTAEKFLKLIKQIKLLFWMIKDYFGKEKPPIPWNCITFAVVAVAYFVSPIDIIPDFIPGVGYIDDYATVMLVYMVIQEDLKKYVEWKELDPNEFFD